MSDVAIKFNGLIKQCIYLTNSPNGKLDFLGNFFKSFEQSSESMDAIYKIKKEDKS